MTSNVTKKRLAVFKFASCDGCQLSLLSCEDELLALTDHVELHHFLEASSGIGSPPYDITLVEGSISTEADIERIQRIREQSAFLATIGACATAGGIQALRNWADHREFLRYVYPNPEDIQTLATSSPIADHVKVDFQLRGCPIDKGQLLELVLAAVEGRTPNLPTHSVCMQCKQRGTVCIAVTRNEPCVGPLTQAGCGAICPAYDRPCYGCFGPAEQAPCDVLSQHYLASGIRRETMVAALRNMNAGARVFQIESDRLESDVGQLPD